MQLIKNLNFQVKFDPAQNQNGVLPLTLTFPLPDGTICVKGLDPNLLNFQVKYAKHRLITGHNADFMNEPLFVQAAQLADDTLEISPWQKDNLARSWNTYICCWAASHAKNLPGDFVECGVNTGMISRAVIHYIDFNSTGKTFYLADTFTGIPEEQVTETEKDFYQNHCGTDVVSHHNQNYYTTDIYEDVKNIFKGFNIKVIQGKVPDTLSQIDTDEICYLSLDMNITAPEIAAAEYFWDKIVPGGVIVIDDYGWDWHLPQKEAFDEFAVQRSVKVLPLPTGQGLIIKP